MSRQLSIRDLIDLTRKSDKTIKKKLETLTPTPGPKGAKLYDSAIALSMLYSDVGDLSTERAKLTVLQQQKAEIEIARLRGELISFNDVLNLFGRQCSAVRARLLAQPTSMAKLLSMESDPAKVKALLEEWIVDALTELTTDKLQNGRFAGSPDISTDAGDDVSTAEAEPS
jgi:hypothetical protein